MSDPQDAMEPEKVPGQLVRMAMSAAFPLLGNPGDSIRLDSAERHARAALAAVNEVLREYGIDLVKGHRGVRELAERGVKGASCTCRPPAGMYRHALNCEGFPNHLTATGKAARA